MSQSYDANPKFNSNKKDLIDFVFRNVNPAPRSFADLGGVWGVDGIYTFYSMDTHQPEAGYLVDTNFTDAVLEREKGYDNLTLINANFGDREVLERIGKVDVVYFFDTLLHQVKPDWEDVLEMYATISDNIVILNQQLVTAEKTVRLLDLGKEEYFRHVPHAKDHPTYTALFEKMYEMHPQHNRIWRDIHNVWQWGITDDDLFSKMKGLGYKLQYFKNCGRAANPENFEDHAFVFSRK